MWSFEEEGAQEASALPQQWVCVRVTTVGGLDNIIDMRNALSEHFMKQVLGQREEKETVAHI